MADPEEAKSDKSRSGEDVDRVYGAIVDAKLLGPAQEIELATHQRVIEILNTLPSREFDMVQQAVSVGTRRLELALEKFGHLHGLTQAEVALLKSQLAGQTVVEHAKLVDVSVNTARTHMRHLLEKTGAANQLDLVRMVHATTG